MRRTTTLWVSGIVVACITVLSMSMRHNDKRSPAVEAIGQLYKTDMQRLDSFLAQYPKYFYDSNHAVRKAKYHELAWRLKRIEGIFAYLHTATAYETFLKPPQFEPHESGPPFPYNWLIAGPFGI